MSPFIRLYEVFRHFKTNRDAKRWRDGFAFASAEILLKNTGDHLKQYVEDAKAFRTYSAFDEGIEAALKKWAEHASRLEHAEGRIYDMYLGDDGEAWSETERYLRQYRPDLLAKADDRQSKLDL